MVWFEVQLLINQHRDLATLDGSRGFFCVIYLVISNTLIFCEGIVEPPTESLAVRSLCLYLDVFGNSPVFLFETERDNADLYHTWLKKIGMYDFIEEIVFPEYNIEGLRLSEQSTRSPFFKLDKISWDNLNFVLSKIS